jgi:hypothetical protein
VTTGPGRALGLLRVAAVTGVTAVLGTVAHTLAGGRLPGFLGYAVLLVLLALATTPLLARAASTRRVVLLVVAGQTFVHAALTATAGHAGDGVATGRTVPMVPAPTPVLAEGARTGTFADLVHPQATAHGGGPTVPDWVLHLLADLQPAQLPMALAHLAAAIGVGLWLASGERALVTLLVLAAAPVLRLARLVVPVAPAPGRSPRPAVRLDVLRRELMLAASLARRGPPVLLRPAT